MNSNFEKLATLFATKNGLAVDKILAGGGFDAGGTLCSILHDAAIDRNRLFVYADLGPPPANHAELALRNLLKQNYDAFAVADSRFSLSPANGHAIFTISLDADTTTLEQLMGEIQAAAALGEEWRRSFFFDVQVGTRI